jgi:hypothetical protein
MSQFYSVIFCFPNLSLGLVSDTLELRGFGRTTFADGTIGLEIAPESTQCGAGGRETYRRCTAVMQRSVRGELLRRSGKNLHDQ